MSGEYRYHCPFCKTEDEKKKLYVNPEKGVYICFRCGAKGRVEKLPFKVTAPRSQKGHNGNASHLFAGDLKPPDGFKLIVPGNVGWTYLLNRGIDPVPLRHYVGTAKNYIVFPIFEKDKLVYYVARKMYGAGLRYRNSNVKGHRLFLPYEMPRTPKPPILIVTEGVFDCLKVWQAGFPALAVLGIAPTSYKILTIMETVHSKGLVVVYLDREAMDTAIEYRNALHPTRGCVIQIPSRKDPGEMLEEEIVSELNKFWRMHNVSTKGSHEICESKQASNPM